jgi:outer membrane protein assembly factor BamD (BamD/ComL family)
MNRVVAACAAVSLAVGVPPALGQEKYELTPEDDWQVTETVDPESPEGQLALARRTLAEGNAAQAERLASEWIEKHDRNRLLPEAYVLRGDALVARKSYYKALFDYEYVARAYPASESFITVADRELEIGTLYARGTKRKWLGMRILDAGDIAEELLIRVQERMPGSQVAEAAAMELADYYFKRRKMTLAVEMYSIFLENYPDSAQTTKARKRLIYSYLATFKGPEFDASGLHDARAKLLELIAVEPAEAERVHADSLLTRIDESDARKLLITARWYLRIGDPVAAELLVRRLVERYPRTVAAADALRLAERLLPMLPPIVVEDAPDYGALRRALLGGPEGAGSADDGSGTEASPIEIEPEPEPEP